MVSRIDPAKAFLGAGWAFPLQLDQDEALTMVAYEEDMAQSIQIILGTNPGERLMRPDFGAGLETFVFEPVNTTTLARIQEQVRGALIDWEPRIDVLDVVVSSDPAEREKLAIDVSYCIRATNSLKNLVYPFYLQEGTAT
jgi:uncharacterized protein